MPDCWNMTHVEEYSMVSILESCTHPEALTSAEGLPESPGPRPPPQPSLMARLA